ncbi:hypothetical protein SAMN05421505_113150 [Sinosporangium album]|uniref:Secreted protein n=1 Tax=Sinosporangium album TaxID=504805 RepID=A0A1G8B5K1_9ACTN|nr:hypothetical protein [Sinosporangium album]SDH28499.1 hypothetical protein SAMN05421505_113150 [Sinosporangium album]
MSRLDALRGPTPPLDHNARSIAALAANPACDRRAVLDAVGVDKNLMAVHLGYSAQFGQSPFAVVRTRQFEEIVRAGGGAGLLPLLREALGLSIDTARWESADESADEGGGESAEEGAGEAHAVRHTRTEALVARAAGDPGTAVVLDRLLLRLDVAGHEVHLEPGVLVFQAGERFHVVTIKPFAVVDGQAETGRVSAAAREAAVYVHAMRALLVRMGLAPDRVSHDVVLVCPENFSNVPTASLLDVRRELSVLAWQLARLTRIDRILDGLPSGLSLDLRIEAGVPTRPAADLDEAVSGIAARYAPECLSACEMAYFCRAEARSGGALDALGRAVRDDLGGVETVGAAIGLATGTRTATAGEQGVAERLRHIRKIYQETVAQETVA